VLSDSPAHIVRRGIEGPPDLLIEVLSPSNRGHDLVTKRSLYARAGVREYWIVDPEAKTLEILSLDQGALRSIVVATGDDVPVSPLLGSLSVHAATLFPDIDEA
jgi:Uma2 family endonuclease